MFKKTFYMLNMAGLVVLMPFTVNAVTNNYVKASGIESVSFSGKDHGYRVDGTLFVYWKLYILMGEPVVGCKAAWRIDNVLNMAEVNSFQNKSGIRLVSAKVQGHFNSIIPKVYFTCDIGVLKPNNQNINWSNFRTLLQKKQANLLSFNVPGSPNWNSLFRTYLGDEKVGEKKARTIFNKILGRDYSINDSFLKKGEVTFAQDKVQVDVSGYLKKVYEKRINIAEEKNAELSVAKRRLQLAQKEKQRTQITTPVSEPDDPFAEVSTTIVKPVDMWDSFVADDVEKKSQQNYRLVRKTNLGSLGVDYRNIAEKEKNIEAEINKRRKKIASMDIKSIIEKRKKSEQQNYYVRPMRMTTTIRK